jgi:hypothetical protein
LLPSPPPPPLLSLETIDLISPAVRFKFLLPCKRPPSNLPQWMKSIHNVKLARRIQLLNLTVISNSSSKCIKSRTHKNQHIAYIVEVVLSVYNMYSDFYYSVSFGLWLCIATNQIVIIYKINFVLQWHTINISALLSPTVFFSRCILVIVGYPQ